MIFLSLLIIPLLVAFVVMWKFERSVTFKEFLLQVALQCAVAGISCMVIYHLNVDDKEIWNGSVSRKAREVVHCRHAYPCNCRSVSCGKNCTTLHCDVCFMHSYDVDWPVFSTVGDRFDIRTIDLQGLREPPRWTSAKIGEPTSSDHRYENYIKAAPGNLFCHQGLVEKYKDQLPQYPGNIYDYYRLDRMVLVGSPLLPDVSEWNRQLSELNAKIGKQKEVNMVIVVVRDKPRDYYYALEQFWIGGKKNDTVAVVDVNGANEIQWVEVMALTTDSIFKVALRDDILDLKTLNRVEFFKVLEKNVVAHYKRKPMSDFKYLTSTVTPTFWQWMIAAIFGLVSSLGLSYWVITQDVFGDERGWHYNNWR